jgi:large subunit ribosomal protein L17
MRHNKKFNHLGRTAAHRNAMLSNMCISLIRHKRIFTTTAKAKELRMAIEPLITKAKEDTTANRRHVFSLLQNKEAVTELFNSVVPKIGDRPGGYTRILKTGYRQGDAAQMCLIELVDYNENMLQAKNEKKARTRRSSSGGRRKKEANTPIQEASSVISDNKVEEKKSSEVTPADDLSAETAAAAEQEVPVTEEKENISSSTEEAKKADA